MSGGNGNGHGAHPPTVPASSPGGAGTTPAAAKNGNGKHAETKDEKPRGKGRQFKPGQSGNPTGAGAGRKPGLPSKNTRLQELLGKTVHPVALEYINRVLKVKFQKGITYDEFLPAFALMRSAGKADDRLLDKLLSYSFLVLDAEVCQLKDPPAAQGGTGVQVNLNQWDQLVTSLDPNSQASGDRPSFEEN